MAANQYGIDLGEIYRTTSAVKGVRTRNRLAGLELSEKERIISERPEKERVARERQNVLYGLRGEAVTGDVSAQQQLLALDPEGGPAFIDAVSKMDDRRIEQTKSTVDEIGKISSYVLQGKTPEEQQRRYSLMLENVSEDVKAKLPDQYSLQFMELSLSKAMAMDKILEAPKAVTVGKEDILYRGGREISRADRPVKGKAGGAGAGGLKSADESLMYRQAAELLGGIFDQQGNITNLDPETRNTVQSIATEAANLFASEGNITRSEAVKRAAQSFGLNVRSPETPNLKDPNSIRDHLLKQ